jgi:nucleoporin POM152
MEAVRSLTKPGVPPYHVEYQIRHTPLKGSVGLTRREFDAMLSKATVQMSTSNPGSYTYKFTSLGDSLYDTQNAKFAPLIVEQRVNAKPTATFAKPGQSFKYCLSDADLGQDDTIRIVLTGAAPFDVEFEIKHQSGTIPETFRIPAINANTYSIQIPRSHLRLGTQHIRIRSVRDARGCFLKTEPVSVGPSVQVTLYEAPSIFPLETKTDYCVGERIAYSLSGTPPFEVWYTFDKTARKAKETTTNFRRLAEQPGSYVITGVSDKASSCRAAVNITREIHPLPAVRISQGKVAKVDIHEGGEVELQFEFFGTPPFEFTYTRSSNEKKGQRSQVLETRHEVSEKHKMSVRTGMEGTYEVVAIKDRWCSYSTGSGRGDGKGKEGQKLLQF